MLPFGGEILTNHLSLCVKNEGTQERAIGTKEDGFFFFASLDASSETQTLDASQCVWTGPLSDSLIPLRDSLHCCSADWPLSLGQRC